MQVHELRKFGNAAFENWTVAALKNEMPQKQAGRPEGRPARVM
jgi:hypothetical protein